MALVVVLTSIAPYKVYSSTPLAALRQRLYVSYKSGDMGEWKRVMEALEISFGRTKSIPTLLELTQTQYGYIGYLIGIDEQRAARGVLKQAEENVELILEKQPNHAEALALRASFIAYQLALNPLKAPVLGPRSLAAIDRALELNANSVQALMEKGNAKHYAPAIFGGNPLEATTFYSKALTQMRRENGGEIPQSWMYLNALTQMALAFEKANRLQDALGVYRQIIKIAPDFKWVVEYLYPKLNRRIQG